MSRTTIYPSNQLQQKVKMKSILKNDYKNASQIYCLGAERLIDKTVERRARFIMTDYNQYLEKRFGKQLMIDNPIFKLEFEEIESYFNDWYKEMIDVDNKFIRFTSWISEKNE